MRLTINVPDLTAEQAFGHVVRRINSSPKRDGQEADIDRAALVVLSNALQRPAPPKAE